MKLTDYDMTVLRTVGRYYLLSASQIHRMCFPGNSDRRTTRRRLSRLVENGYLARSTTNVAFSTGNAGPAYHSTLKGCETLAVYYDDDAWLSTNLKPTRPYGFENQSEQNGTFHKVQILRTYKDGDDFKTTPTFSRDELPIVGLLSQQAWEYVLAEEARQRKGQNDD